jgi:hypothetical protein
LREQWFTNPTEENEKLKAAFMAKALDFKKFGKELLDFTANAKEKVSLSFLLFESLKSNH